jgi:hypothetical protein
MRLTHRVSVFGRLRHIADLGDSDCDGMVEEMTRHQVTGDEVRRSQSARLRRRRRWYFGLMGVCLVLIVLAWNVVRLWSTTAAVVMSVVAAVLPPVAAIVANWGEDH